MDVGILEFLHTAVEENVDVMAVLCPYLLERCLMVVLRAANHLVHGTAPHSNLGSHKDRNREVGASKAETAHRSSSHISSDGRSGAKVMTVASSVPPQKPPTNAKKPMQLSLLQPSVIVKDGSVRPLALTTETLWRQQRNQLLQQQHQQHQWSGGAASEAMWRALRLLRAVPSEVMCHLSDRLACGVFAIIR